MYTVRIIKCFDDFINVIKVIGDNKQWCVSCGGAGRPCGRRIQLWTIQLRPIIDRLAREGNPEAFQFAKPNIPGYDYSFSGLKTSFLYSLRNWVKEDPNFVQNHLNDLAASLEKTIVDILMKKLRMAAKDLGIKQVAVAGGVSANTGLRNAFLDHAKRYKWKVFIPKFGYTTDNAAMIAMAGTFKYHDRDFCPMSAPAKQH